MAINFKQLKDPKLALTDILSFGKLKGCRVCDIIEEHYEYLIFLDKQGIVKYQDIVLETIKEIAGYKNWEPPEKPVESYKPISYTFDDSWTDDVPF
jgi:hypothetical protein